MKVTITNDEGEVFEILTCDAGGIWTDSVGEFYGDHDEALFGKNDEDYPLAGTAIAGIVAAFRRAEAAKVAS